MGTLEKGGGALLRERILIVSGRFNTILMADQTKLGESITMPSQGTCIDCEAGSPPPDGALGGP